jgi:hypothetical protein
MQKLLLLLFFAATTNFAIGQNTTAINYTQLYFKDLDKLCNDGTREIGNLTSTSELMTIVYKLFAINTLKNDYVDFDWSWAFYQAIERIKNTGFGASLMADPKQVKAIYNAAIPDFKAQFARMTAAERAAYLKMIDEAIGYSQKFDLAKENADLASLESSGKSFANEKGKLNAFIYRRLAKKELTKADCVKWLKQARKDLASAKIAPNQGKAGEYILHRADGNRDLLVGHIFGKKDEKAILVADAGGYKILWEGKTEYISSDKHIVRIENLSQDSAHFYQLGKDKKLSFIVTKNNISSFVGLFDSAGVVFNMNDKRKPSEAYVLNEQGKFERHEVGRDKNFYLLTMQSGEKKIVWLNRYASQQPNLSKIKNPKQVYASDNNTAAWILDADNKLHYFKGEYYISHQLSDKADSIKIINSDDLLLYYANKNAEMLQINLSSKLIDKVLLPKGYNISFVRQISKVGNAKHYRLFLAGGLMGIIDENAKIIIAPEYNNIMYTAHPKEFYYYLRTSKGLIGRAKTDGTILIPPKYIELKDINLKPEVFCILFRNQDSLVGLMSHDGEEILPAKYRQIITNYSAKPPHLLIFEDANKKYGVMNTEFKTIIPATYTYLDIKYITNDTSLYFTFSTDDGKKEIGLLDANGKILIAPSLSDFQVLYKRYDGENVAREPHVFLGSKNIGSEEKYALFSTKTFKPLTDFVFTTWVSIDTIIQFDPETFMEMIQLVQYFQFYRSNNPRYSQPSDALILRQAGKQTVYDKFGKMLIPPVWDSIAFVSSKAELYYVSKNNKWGILDAKNKPFIPADYDTIYQHIKADLFFVAKAQADKSLKYAIFDAKGKPCTDFVFNSGATDSSFIFDAETFESYKIAADMYPGGTHNSNSIILLQNDKFFVYDFNGKPIIATPYQKISYLNRDIANAAFVVTNDKSQIAFFAPDGKPVSDFIYKSFDANTSSAVKLDGTSVKINEKGQEVK